MLIKDIINKKGRFRLSYVLMAKMELEKFNRLFYNVVIIHSETDYTMNDNIIMYTAISPFFDEVKEGDLIPEYQIISHRKGRGALSIEFEKIKK